MAYHSFQELVVRVNEHVKLVLELGSILVSGEITFDAVVPHYALQSGIGGFVNVSQRCHCCLN